ncbi:uncharacterized protein LOC142526274 isoform X1 [Primulina tabacum]|uniref:uncharacterized protein LOC142526274 isoform X1 n=1 Tax=Primulina tabacum TaxID=48773 RepID=UPI003F59B7D7
MATFVKKLVEKASLKKPGGLSDTLKPDDVDPRLVFHYGVPPGSLLLKYNSIRQILAIATKDGRIKLYGKGGSQALLESPEIVPSKILLFMENQGVLVNVNVNNHIEVWDIDTKCLSTVHRYEKEITSIRAIEHSPYLYVGDSAGYISVLRVDQEQRHIEQMIYHIPLSASRKNNEVESEIAVKYILPQPTAETKRVLIIHCDGVITLWAIQESTVVFTSVSTTLQSLYQETKKVTAACWVSTAGTKVAVGYSNGDILLWSVPCPSDSKTEQVSINETNGGQITPVCKLNLGYKVDKIPISKLKWIDVDGKSSRLYVLGLSENFSTNLQVVLLNEHTESRTIKLTLSPPESLVDLEIITSSFEHKRHDSLLLLGKSSHIYYYDDCLIERYLVQCQNKSSPSLPKEQMIKLPYGDSSITVSKFMTCIPSMPYSSDEEFNIVAKNSLPLFPFERRLKDGSNPNSMAFSPLTRDKNLFITGHDNGTINFWDASCPLFIQVASITQQSDDNFSVSGCALTALHFDFESHTLVSGDKSGMVRIYVFKSETFAPQSSFVSFQGISKKGSNHIINRIKLVKVNGAVLSINMTKNLKQLAVGTDQGYVSLVDVEGPTILYQRLIASEFSKGIISTHFETCSFHGFEKNILLVATKDSSVLALECDSGNTVSSSSVRPKKPSRALYTRILDVQGISDNINSNNTMTKQSLVLLCSEKAVYVYSLSHVVQGVRKVLYKKKFNSSCFWASTFGSSDDGLFLLFTSGKFEIRSLPELSLAKESSVRGFSFSTLKSPSTSNIIVSSSQDGELIIVNGNQELLFVSTLLHKEAYRLLDSVTQVFNKDLVHAQGCISISSAPLKEKKKGIFGSLVKDNNTTKSKTGLEVESHDSRRSIEELSTIFSKANFAIQNENEAKVTMSEEDVELDIDDIDIEDVKEKPKGYPVIAGLNKQNITNKFWAIKGKLKYAKVKNEKVPVHELQDEKTGAIDQIKKKYGYSSSGESSVANIARSKLGENMRKLQGLNIKTTEMHDTAQSFYSMARDVLRFAENEKNEKGGS